MLFNCVDVLYALYRLLCINAMLALRPRSCAMRSLLSAQDATWTQTKHATRTKTCLKVSQTS